MAPQHSDVDQTVTYTVTTTEPNGDSQSVSEVITYNINAVADAPNVLTTDAGGGVDQPVDLNSLISVSLVDTDGSETLTSITIANIPAGAQLLDNGVPITLTGGSATIFPAQLDNLVFQPPAGATGNYTLQISATSAETNPENGVAVATATTGPIDLNIAIDNIDDPVTSHDDATVVGSGNTVTFNVLGNDQVPDGGSAVIEVDGQAISSGQTLSSEVAAMATSRSTLMEL